MTNAIIPEFKSVLYCTDLSDNSIEAFRYAVAIAKATGADIHILHVVEKLSEDAVVTLQAFIQDESQRNAAIYARVAAAEKLVKDRQDAFWLGLDNTDAGLRQQIKSVEVVESYPAATILKRSEELSCDLIIMGGHDRGMSHHFLGTVAKSVLRRSSIPALIVPLTDI